MNIVARTLSMIAFLVSMGPQQAFAADYYRINENTSAKIDEHNVCRVVTNKVGTPVNIPTNLKDEWSTGASSFMTNIPDDLVVAPCNRPDVFASCPPASASTLYGRRPTYVVIAAPRASIWGAQNNTRGAVNDMVDEMKACGGNISVSYVESYYEGTYSSNDNETGGAGTGNQDSATREFDWLARDNLIASQGAFPMFSSSYFNVTPSIALSVESSASYMRSLIRVAPQNARFVYVLVGATNLTMNSRARGYFDDMMNTPAQEGKDNSVQVVMAGLQPASTASYLGVNAGYIMDVSSADEDAAMWAVGRNISMYAVGQTPNMRFNTAQRAALGF